jgi:hypothetical protein
LGLNRLGLTWLVSAKYCALVDEYRVGYVSVGEGGFAGAGDAGDGGQYAGGVVDVDVVEVVPGGAAGFDGAGRCPGL